MSGGSSSGCGAATAAGCAPVSLGSDTNGSIRVPAALCGVFSLKPTYGRLPRTGTFSFVDSLDHLGPFARTPRDLARAFDAVQGHDPGDHACMRRPTEAVEPALDAPLANLRIGVPGGWFARFGGPAGAVAAGVAETLAVETAGSVAPIDLDAAEAGRAAAYLITNAESAAFHLDRLRTRAGDFDPDTRDRFLAGALIPAAWITRAHRVRAWWRDRALAAFAQADLLVVPATPVVAPSIGARVLEIDGVRQPLRPSLGLLAQPFSCIGVPVVTVPVFAPDAALPHGVQIVAPPWQEARALQAAEVLARSGLCRAKPPADIAAVPRSQPDALARDGRGTRPEARSVCVVRHALFDGVMTIALEDFSGPGFAPHVEALAALRIGVFRDWPYLYDGDATYEADYLRTYTESPEAVIVAAWDDGRLVGAATGAPMEDHAEEFGAPLERAGVSTQ